MGTHIAVIAFLFFSASPSPCDTSSQGRLGIVVEGVAKAARSGKLELLGEFMSEDFLYSFGGSRSKAEALEWYQKHPNLLKKLTEVLSSKCAMTDA